MNRVSRSGLEQEIASENTEDEKKKKELNRGEEENYDAEKEESRIRNKGLKEFYAQRKLWSWFILFWISALIIFNIVLTLGIGGGFFDFHNMQWFVTSVTAETFIQIVGLGYVAARYLFSREQQLDKQRRSRLLPF